MPFMWPVRCSPTGSLEWFDVTWSTTIAVSLLCVCVTRQTWGRCRAVLGALIAFCSLFLRCTRFDPVHPHERALGV
eukprot:6957570-Prymnesium_polylepis.1